MLSHVVGVGVGVVVGEESSTKYGWSGFLTVDTEPGTCFVNSTRTTLSAGNVDRS